ncbi:MAG: histidine phosphatase family protein [Actinocatenispora sp.]
MTRIVLTRHGETVWHAENRYTGSSDVGLTDRGLAQAAALGRWAHREHFEQVWTSDLARARETAEPAARALGVPLRVDPRLRELDFGRGEGRTLADMRQLFPGEVDEFLTDPGGNPLPGGEPPAEAVTRARAGLADIAARCDGPVLVVLHSTLLRLLLCDLLGVPLGRYRSLFPVVDNVALTELDWRGDGVALLRYNTPLPVGPGPADRDHDARPVRSQTR